MCGGVRRGFNYTNHAITKIDVWCIDKFAIMREMEAASKKGQLVSANLPREFQENCSSRTMSREDRKDLSEQDIRQMRKDNGIVAAYKIVDTCAACILPAEEPEYSCIGSGELRLAPETNGCKKLLVLGSGPISYRPGN